MTRDPTRLLDDPSVAPALRDDLSQAARVEVVGLDHAGGLAALQQAAAASAPTASTSLATKLGLGAALCGGAVALWLAWGGASPTAAPQVAGPVTAPELPARDPAPAEDGSEAAPEPIEAPERADDRLAEPATAADEPEPEPVEPEPEPIEPEPVEPEPSSRSNAGHGARVHRDDPAPEPSAEPPVDDVLREARLVAKARSKLALDPAGALALAEEAERDFPEGQLIEERRAIAIHALLALGRIDEAQRRAEPFLSTYGRGAHAAAVRRDLAKAKPVE